jgi:hypothetical protein
MSIQIDDLRYLSNYLLVYLLLAHDNVVRTYRMAEPYVVLQRKSYSLPDLPMMDYLDSLVLYNAMMSKDVHPMQLAPFNVSQYF